MDNFKVRIRPTVLMVILTLVSFAVFITLGIQYYFSKRLAHQVVENSAIQISQKVESKINAFNKTSYDFIHLVSNSNLLEVQPKITQNRLLLKQFTTAIKNNPLIYAIYFGYENRDFYEIINLNIDDTLKKRFKTKINERWMVVKIFLYQGNRIRLEQYLDENLNLLRSVYKQAKYNPMVRPWYLQAKHADAIITTQAYKFSNLDALGVTYAKKINKQITMGVDVSLKSFSTFLKQQEVFPKTQIYLFDESYNVIASNMPYQFYDKKLSQRLEKSLTQNKQVINVSKEDYLVSTLVLNSSYSNNNYLAIFTNESEILKPFNEKIIYSLMINFGLMLLTLPLIWISTRLIIKPIHQLMQENKKIGKREFEHVSQVNTSIKELYDLSTSFVFMAQSIKQYEESQKELMDAFIQVIATSIDTKSAYTGGHCRRVPILTQLIAKKASASNEGIFKEFSLQTQDELHELSVAAWLHDCGKITIPDYVVDKATKLETIYNRIHEIRMRFEVIHRDLEIKAFEKIADGGNKEEIKQWLKKEQDVLQDEFSFIAKMNEGGEYTSLEDIQKVHTIAKRVWKRYFDDSLGLSYEEQKRYIKSDSLEEQLLSDKAAHIIKRDNQFYEQENTKYQFKVTTPEHLYNLGEIYNLSIERGTLTHEERFKINEHMMNTIKMLEQLPFPENLQRVPEYASAHHETLIGTGYPRKLKKEQMSIPARIMAVADVFEALTAADRPYKKAKSLSQAIEILSYMVEDKHLDADIFRLFLQSGAYLEYAKEFLEDYQIDEVDIQSFIHRKF